MFPQSILIVSCSNYPNSLTSSLAYHYAEILSSHSVAANVLDLSTAFSEFMNTSFYSGEGATNFLDHAKKCIMAANKYVFIVPDYNGSFPGILKIIIDELEYPTALLHKKCSLVSISKGFRGGSFALSHLTDIFHHFKMYIYPLVLTFSRVQDNKLETILSNLNYNRLLQEQAKGIVNF